LIIISPENEFLNAATALHITQQPRQATGRSANWLIRNEAHSNRDDKRFARMEFS